MEKHAGCPKAIQAVHQAGLVHGDLTPSNILVDARDRITITDFGFSQTSANSISPILGGTLGFAAPEQIDPVFGAISDKTDIYAIGGLVHWFVYQRPPNAGRSVAAALSQTLSAEDQLRSNADSIPKVFHKILADTLCKSPTERSMSTVDIIRLL